MSERPKNDGPRNLLFPFRVTEAERAELHKAAEILGLQATARVREIALKDARRIIAKSKK